MKKIRSKDVVAGGAVWDVVLSDVRDAIEGYHGYQGSRLELAQLEKLPVRWGGIFVPGMPERAEFTDKVLFRIVCDFYKDTCNLKQPGIGIGLVKKHRRVKGVLIYWRRK